MDEDGSRYLLGDYVGNLYLLVLQHDGEHVAGLKVEPLGRTSAPSTLTYLDNGVVFVGSSGGDSQLVRCLALSDEPGLEGPNVNRKDNMMHLYIPIRILTRLVQL